MRSIVLVCLALSQVSGFPQPPPRDTPPPRAGTGAISGIVTAADTGLALRRATVMLSGPPSRGGATNRSGTTDIGGRFLFTALPPGTYRLRAMPGNFRGQYLMSAYGGRRPGDMGEVITLKDAQHVADAHIALPRGGAITGRVIDEFGDPMARMAVYPARALPSGAGFSRAGSGASTDDLGRFRIYGLEPGEYIVAVDARIGGGGPPVEGESEGFATTFYPSALSEREAGRVRVPAGGDSGEIHIQLVRTRTFKITGVVMDSEGTQLMHPNAMLARAASGADYDMLSLSFDQAGRFTIRDVVPGEYRLVVRPGFIGPPGMQPADPVRQEYAILPLNVTADLDLVVVTSPGVSIGGAVVFAEGAPPGPPSRVRIHTEPGDRMAMMGPPPSTVVGPDLRFTLKNAFGPLLVRVTGLPRGHAVQAVMLGQTDITDTAVEFKPAHSGQLRVVVTSRVGNLEGQIFDDSGAPAVGATLVIIPEERSAWHRRSSRFRILAGFNEGKFTARALLPGRYHVVALASGEFGMSGEPPPEFFEELMKLATEVLIGEDETRTLELRLAKRSG